MLLINCEIELDLTWSKNYIISEISRPPEVGGDNPVEATSTAGATFQIKNAKFYLPVVFWSLNGNIKFLENLKQGYKRTISWNKHRSVITTQHKNNNSYYIIDVTFRNINRLFFLSLKIDDDDCGRSSFGEYYMPSVEIKGLMH